LAGMIPLGCSLAVFHGNSGCGCVRCASLCQAACVIGGMLAGAAVGFLGVRYQDRKRLGYWIEASGLALLTGSLGCSCMGFAGITSLMGGYAIGIGASAVRFLFEKEKTNAA
jgi:hypothetical protein